MQIRYVHVIHNECVWSLIKTHRSKVIIIIVILGHLCGGGEH